MTKVIVIGFARHGKDTVAEMLGKYGLTHISATHWIAENLLKDRYDSVEHALQCKDNDRAIWFNAVAEYNKDFKGKLITEMLSQCDIYSGVRCPEELVSASNHLLETTGCSPIILWVDNPDKPQESQDSCKVSPYYADYVVENSGTLEQLEEKIDTLYNAVIKNWKHALTRELL